MSPLEKKTMWWRIGVDGGKWVAARQGLRAERAIAPIGMLKAKCSQSDRTDCECGSVDACTQSPL